MKYLAKQFTSINKHARPLFALIILSLTGAANTLTANSSFPVYLYQDTEFSRSSYWEKSKIFDSLGLGGGWQFRLNPATRLFSELQLQVPDSEGLPAYQTSLAAIQSQQLDFFWRMNLSVGFSHEFQLGNSNWNFEPGAGVTFRNHTFTGPAISASGISPGLLVRLAFTRRGASGAFLLGLDASYSPVFYGQTPSRDSGKSVREFTGIQQVAFQPFVGWLF